MKSLRLLERIKNIQSKPEAERIKIMWILVAIFMVGVVAIFIYSLKSIKIENSGKILKGVDELKKEIEMPKIPDFDVNNLKNLPTLPTGEVKGEMDGIEAAEKIRNHFNIPVVYLAAYMDEKTLQRAETTGPFGYILKPFEERELHTTIETTLSKFKI